MDESTLPQHPPPQPVPTQLLPPIAAETYVYLRDNNLEIQLWSYEDFVRQNAWQWYKPFAADHNEYLAEVDKARADVHKRFESVRGSVI